MINQSKNNIFSAILALDHGLTVGHGSVLLHKLPKLINDCRDYIDSVVATYGFAKYIEDSSLSRIIQCFGAPEGHPKIQVCNIEDALRVQAKAIAVQVDFELTGNDMTKQLRSISKLTSQAHSRDLTVLFMVAPQKANSIHNLLNSIRFCIELGADMIKIRSHILEFDEKSQKDFSELLEVSPPILLAGGEVNENILKEVEFAKKIGFHGYCIGRNIFKSDNPKQISQKLYNIYYD